METNLLKNLLTIVMLTFYVMHAYCEPVDEKTAHKVAVKILSSSYEMRSSSTDSTQLKSPMQQKTLQLLYKSSSNNGLRSQSADKEKETVYFYVFGTESNEGFVIVSGDDRVVPVLGYSDTNGFNAENMPQNLRWWLDEYARQIQFAIDNNIEPTSEVSQQWTQYLGNNGKEERK